MTMKCDNEKENIIMIISEKKLSSCIHCASTMISYGMTTKTMAK